MTLRQYWLVIVILFAGGLLSVLTFFAVRSSEIEYGKYQFIDVTQGNIATIEREITNHFNVLNTISLFFSSATPINQRDFATVGEWLLNQYSGIESLYWLPYVTQKQRESWEQQLQTTSSNSGITELDSHGQKVAAGLRTDYFPIQYALPQTRFATEIGVDLSVDTTVAPLLTRARQLQEAVVGYTVASHILSAWKNIYVVYPIYFTHDVEKPFQGFIVGILNFRLLFENHLKSINKKNIDIVLLDESLVPSERLLFSVSDNPSDNLEIFNNAQNSLKIGKNIKIADRTWLIQFSISSNISLKNTQLAVFILGGGIGLTVLLAFYIFVITQRTVALRREIAERRRISDELQEKEHEFRVFANSAPVILWMTDAQGKCLLLNQAALNFIGYVSIEAFSRRWTEAIHPEDVNDCLQIYRTAFTETHENFTMTYRIRRQDGEYRWLSEKSSVRFHSNGEFIGFVGACTDLTERKRMEEQLRMREEEFNTFVNCAPVMLWMSDTQGQRILFNHTWLQFTGRNMEEELSFDWQRSIHSDDVNHCLSAYFNALKKRQDFKITYRCQRADGIYRWLSETTTARFNVQGDFMGFIGACTDITEQKEAEKAMYESQRALSTLMSNLPGMAYRRRNDAKWTMEFVSQGCIELTGYEPSDFVNNWRIAFADLIHPEDQKRLWDIIQIAVQEDRPYKFRYRLMTREGREKWAWEQGQPVFTDNGRLRALEGFILDITEQKLAEIASNRAKQMAEEANLAKTQFLANMSHELRTPLNAIMGYSEMLQEEAEDLELPDFIPDLIKIRAAGKHLLSLINDILNISKLEAGKMELFAETFMLQHVIDEVVATIEPIAAIKQDILQIHCSDNLGEMYSDLTKVRQILLNLLSNACKFSTNSLILLEAQREASEHDDWITLRITDNGIGITPEQQEKLFQIFMQADASTTRKYGGTGLGLALTYQFVQMMHGTITVDSVFGEGSVFTVRLPCHVDMGHPIHIHKPTKSTHTEGQAAKRILVVEDDATTRDLMAQLLTRAGYEVLKAENGHIALQAIGKRKPHLILLDLIMPEMDGFELIRHLHTEESMNQIPIIVLTAKDLMVEEYMQLEESVKAIFQKGIYQREVLFNKLQELLQTTENK